MKLLINISFIIIISVILAFSTSNSVFAESNNNSNNNSSNSNDNGNNNDNDDEDEDENDDDEDEDEDDDKVTICHVVPNPDQTITVSESALSAHLAHGDTSGACATTPEVPEFGLITGAMALLSSGGAFYFIKKRNN